jgi:Cft2 family RNA processing exonuclease
MEEKTPGFRIANAVKGDRIKLSDNAEAEIVKCEIKRFRFPSHALREELIEIVKRVNPAKVILVHGDSLAIDWVGARIINEYKHIKVFSAEEGKELLL